MEVNKARSTSLHVWEINKCGLKVADKILKFTYKNLNGKLTCYPFFYSIFKDLCQFIQHRKIPPFFYNIDFGFGGNFSSPRARPCYSSCYKPRLIMQLRFHFRRINIFSFIYKWTLITLISLLMSSFRHFKSVMLKCESLKCELCKSVIRWNANFEKVLFAEMRILKNC